MSPRALFRRFKPRRPARPGNEAVRHQWIRDRLVELPAGGRLLDAGAGEQPYRGDCGHLDYVAQDVGEYDGAGDGVGLQMGSFNFAGLDLVCDVADVPEPDASFDAVLCSEVLEHVPDPTRALDEFARLLKDGGVLLLTAPFCSLTHFAPYHFSTGLSRYWYVHHLERLGFDIVEATPNGNYFDYLDQELSRLPAMARRYAGGVAFSERRIHRLRRTLRKLSDRRGDSSALLTFGWHIRGVRRRTTQSTNAPAGDSTTRRAA